MKPTANFLPLVGGERLDARTAGKSVLPVASTTTLAARYWKSAPGIDVRWSRRRRRAYGARAVQPSTGRQPPFWMRRSSSLPLSNSWLPTEAKSTFIRLVAMVIGSSKKRPFASGLAPMLSPAKTVACRSPYWRLLVLDGLGQVGGAAGELAVDVGAGGLEVAVEVVEGQQVDVRRRALLLRFVRDRDGVRDRPRACDDDIGRCLVGRRERRHENCADHRCEHQRNGPAHPPSAESVSHAVPPFPVTYLLDARRMLTYVVRPERCVFGENPVARPACYGPRDGTPLTGLRKGRLTKARLY